MRAPGLRPSLRNLTIVVKSHELDNWVLKPTSTIIEEFTWTTLVPFAACLRIPSFVVSPIGPRRLHRARKMQMKDFATIRMYSDCFCSSTHLAARPRVGVALCCYDCSTQLRNPITFNSRIMSCGSANKISSFSKGSMMELLLS